MTPSIVSIHDVAPETLRKTLKILRLLEQENIKPITLLVIPGRDWSDRDIKTLKALEGSGHYLAGHGWTHQCSRWGSFGHRVHSRLLSRDQAEHMALSRNRIEEMLRHCFDWFGSVGLATPRLYVPPAWAMGDIQPSSFGHLPFDAYETLTGVFYVRSQRFDRLPLVGFEADTLFRSLNLRALNQLNRCLAFLLDKPLRIAIHPYDFELFLSSDLKRLLRHGHRYIGYF